jgi:hypothetical protein
MSSMAKSAREAMKAKAKRLGSDRPVEKVDSSTFTPPELLDADVKTGLRPVSRRAFKKGGKVMGTACEARADRKPRKSGGAATATEIANAKVNRNVKAANEEREGKKHIGGMKKGGRAKHATKGAVDSEQIKAKPDYKIQQRMDPSKYDAEMDLSKMPQPSDMYSPEDMIRLERGYKKGGRAKKMVGGPQVGAAQMMKRAQATADVPAATMNFSRTAPSKFSKSLGMKKGGKAHEDVAADKALIKKMVKKEARTGKAIGGAFGQFLSPALMLANAIRGDDKKRGGRAGKQEGGGTKAPVDMEYYLRAKRREDLGDDSVSHAIAESEARKNKAFDEAHGTQELKRGGKAERKGRKTGGGVFSGAGYPHKVPGVVPGGRDARKAGGRTKGKTNINIVIAAGKGQDQGDMLPPGAQMGKPGAMPVPVPPPGGMPMPSAGAPAPAGIPMQMPPMPPAGGGGMPPMARKAGGRISKIASSYKDMTAGAGGGEGRLQKTDIAKRGERKAGGKVYKSYKDMDAGAGSGLGRLEKTEIAARKG